MDRLLMLVCCLQGFVNMFGHKAVSFAVPDGGPIWSGQQASESSDCSVPVCPASEVAQAASSDASGKPDTLEELHVLERCRCIAHARGMQGLQAEVLHCMIGLGNLCFTLHGWLGQPFRSRPGKQPMPLFDNAAFPSRAHPVRLCLHADELSERLPNLSELLSGSSSSKRRARRTLHAEPVDEYGCLRTPEDLKKVKRCQLALKFCLIMRHIHGSRSHAAAHVH